MYAVTSKVLLRTVLLTLGIFAAVFLVRWAALSLVSPLGDPPLPEGPHPEPPPELHPDARRLLGGLSVGDRLGGLLVQELRGPVRERIELVLLAEDDRPRRLWVTRGARAPGGSAAASDRYAIIVEGSDTEPMLPAVQALQRLLEQHEGSVPVPPGL